MYKLVLAIILITSEMIISTYAGRSYQLRAKLYSLQTNYKKVDTTLQALNYKYRHYLDAKQSLTTQLRKTQDKIHNIVLLTKNKASQHSSNLQLVKIDYPEVSYYEKHILGKMDSGQIKRYLYLKSVNKHLKNKLHDLEDKYASEYNKQRLPLMQQQREIMGQIKNTKNTLSIARKQNAMVALKIKEFKEKDDDDDDGNDDDDDDDDSDDDDDDDDTIEDKDQNDVTKTADTLKTPPATLPTIKNDSTQAFAATSIKTPTIVAKTKVPDNTNDTPPITSTEESPVTESPITKEQGLSVPQYEPLSLNPQESTKVDDEIEGTSQLNTNQIDDRGLEVPEYEGF